eukprot:229234-Amorphochlora_amoeboformis.AAC.2
MNLELVGIAYDLSEEGSNALQTARTRARHVTFSLDSYKLIRSRGIIHCKCMYTQNWKARRF